MCGVLKQYNPEAGDSVMSTIFSTLIHMTDKYEYVLKKFSWMNAGIAWNDYISCKHEIIILKSIFSCTYSFYILRKCWYQIKQNEMKQTWKHKKSNL